MTIAEMEDYTGCLSDKGRRLFEEQFASNEKFIHIEGSCQLDIKEWLDSIRVLVYSSPESACKCNYIRWLHEAYYEDGQTIRLDIPKDTIKNIIVHLDKEGDSILSSFSELIVNNK